MLHMPSKISIFFSDLRHQVATEISNCSKLVVKPYQMQTYLSLEAFTKFTNNLRDILQGRQPSFGSGFDEK